MRRPEQKMPSILPFLIPQHLLPPLAFLLVHVQVQLICAQATTGRRDGVGGGAGVGGGSLKSGEFCERESFEASCADDEVILMRSAVYGRMNYGKCVQTEYSSLGCSADVLGSVSSWCSGRQQCRFAITDLHDAKPCPRELIAYLEASYECVAVSQCPLKSCVSGDSLAAPSTSGEGYIASSVTATSDCGSFKCPWVIQAKPGQRLNLTFHSFFVMDDGPQQNKFCHRLAAITDLSTRLSKDVTLCSKDTRVMTHLTSTDTVHVKLYLGSQTKPANFILHYQAFGCPDIEAPSGGWVKRNGNLMTAGCNDRQRTWHLTCDRVTWVGQIGDCDAPDLTPNWNVHSALEKAKSTTEGILMVVGLGVFIGVVTGCSMLTVVIIVIKRRRRKMALQYDRRRETQYSEDGATILGDQYYSHKLCDKDIASQGATTYDLTDIDRAYEARGTGYATGAAGPPGGFSYLCSSSDVNARFHHHHDVPGAHMMTLAGGVCAPATGHVIADCGKEHAYETPNFST